MYVAVKLVCHGCVGVNTADAQCQLCGRRCFILTAQLSNASCELLSTCFQVLGDEIQHLRTIMRSGIGPAFSLACSFDGITDIFTPTLRVFSYGITRGIMCHQAVTTIGAYLLATNVEFGSAINGSHIQRF